MGWWMDPDVLESGMPLLLSRIEEEAAAEKLDLFISCMFRRIS